MTKATGLSSRCVGNGKSSVVFTKIPNPFEPSSCTFWATFEKTVSNACCAIRVALLHELASSIPPGFRGWRSLAIRPRWPLGCYLSGLLGRCKDSGPSRLSIFLSLAAS